MSKLRSTPPADARRRAGSPDPAQARDTSSEAARRAAVRRFSYSGGYDGYEGRMMPRPDAEKPSR